MGVVSNILEQRIADGALTRDPAQVDAAKHLDDVLERLKKSSKGGWFSKPKPARDLYL